MEFQFLAQQQLKLFINAYLVVFTIAFIICCIAVYLAGKDKKVISRAVLYISLIISGLSFAAAVSVSTYNPYDSLFTEEVLQFIQVSNYVIAAIIGLLAISAFFLARKRSPLQ